MQKINCRSQIEIRKAGSSEYIASKPTLYAGNDRTVRMPEASPPVKFLGEDVTLNFEQAPLTEVVHAIMGDILKLDTFFFERGGGAEVELFAAAPNADTDDPRSVGGVALALRFEATARPGGELGTTSCSHFPEGVGSW